MDHLQRFTTQVRNHQTFVLFSSNALLIGGWWVGSTVFKLDPMILLAVLITLGVALSIGLGFLSSNYITQPLKVVWQAVLHIAPDTANVPAPELKSARLGNELVTNLVSHVYQLATVVANVEKMPRKQSAELKANFVANSLPLPLVLLDKNQTIIFANKPLADYIQRTQAEIIGQNVYSVLDLSFSSSNRTFDAWLSDARANKPVDMNTWERVRLTLPDQKTVRQLDLAAYYNKNNPDGLETMLVLFDHTVSYSQDDQGLSFVALAVHELRTPVTLLRGYIEAFEEDLSDKLSPETADFMHKMKAAAQQLTTFINNILNVARIENDQLTLKLHEEVWANIVQAAVSDISIRARVQGIEVTTEIAPNLPTVGVDPVSIYEVINNLLDNAIKYSGKSKQIIVRSYLNQEGLVETSVQDFGVGVAANILPNMFDKFYRSYHNRTQVGGTGLGLYLAKALVEAQGGHIWVQSKEGEGSVFGFSVVPYANLAEEQKSGDNKDIVRNAHGWIKNHSLYRG